MTSTTHGRTWRRGRGLVAGAATLGLAASLLAVGVGSANAVVTPKPVWKDNPDLKASCGLDVVLVLDASKSIATSSSTADVKSAAATLVAAFKDTNTRVGITTFASSTISAQPLVDDNADNAATLSAAVAAYAPSTAEGTDWEAGVAKGTALFTDGGKRPGVQQLMIVVTDGAPNKYIDASGTPVQGVNYPSPSLDAVTPAVDRANLFKAAGGRVLGIGVGTDFAATGAATRISYLERLSQYAIQNNPDYSTIPGQVAGPTSVTNPTTGSPYAAFNPMTTDTLIQPDFKTLGTSFRAIADNVCNSTLNLVNVATSATSPLVYRSGGAGWTSNVALNAGLAVDWVNPTPATAVDGGNEDNTSAASGVSVYQWFNSAAGWTRTAHVALAQKTSYTLVSVSCSKKVGASSVAVPVTVVSGQFDVTVGGGQITCLSRSKYAGIPQAVVSIAPRSVTKVYPLTSTTLSGKVLRPSTTVAGAYLPVKAAKVSVQYLTAGTTVWRGLRTLTTSTTGAYAIVVRPSFTTTYRVVYAGITNSLLGNKSANAVLRVSTKVTVKLNKNNVALGTTVTFSGAVAPNKKGQLVTLQAFIGGKWKNVKSVALSATSTYAIAYKTTSRNDYKWRVIKAGDVTSYTGVSPTITLIVK
jgi:Mg-chelatase subunit ChlD